MSEGQRRAWIGSCGCLHRGCLANPCAPPARRTSVLASSSLGHGYPQHWSAEGSRHDPLPCPWPRHSADRYRSRQEDCWERGWVDAARLRGPCLDATLLRPDLPTFEDVGCQAFHEAGCLPHETNRSLAPILVKAMSCQGDAPTPQRARTQADQVSNRVGPHSFAAPFLNEFHAFSPLLCLDQGS